MPRNDGTGPLGGGPRTGWGRGRCGRSADEAGAVEGFRRGEGAGRHGRRWGGGGGRGCGNDGKGRGRGFGMGWRASRDSAQTDGTLRGMQAFLRRLIRELTAQLDGVNRSLSAESSDGARDREQEQL